MVEEDRIKGPQPPSQPPVDARIVALRARLAAVEQKNAGGGRSTSRRRSRLANGLNVALEFSGGVIVGLVLGVALDRFFETSPGCLLIGLLVGSAAGWVNIIRWNKNTRDNER